MHIPAVACLLLATLMVGEVRAIAFEETWIAQQPPQPQPHLDNSSTSSIYYYENYQTAPISSPSAVAPTNSAAASADRSFPVPGAAQTPAAPAHPIDFPRPSTVPISPASPPVAVPPQINPTPINTSDLAVTALSVQVAGGSPELQQVVLQTIQTRPGGATSRTQLQRDVATILNTSLFVTTTVASFARAEGVDVLFTVEPVVVRSLQLAGARALSSTTANQFFQTQIGQPISPSTLRQAVEQINQWYADNGYTLARVLALRPSRDGVITVDVAEGIVSQVNIRFVNEQGNPTNEQGEPIQGRTRESFIRREIRLQPGQVFNETAARQDLQRLFQLGLFDNANIILAGDAQAVNVTYDLRERPPRSFHVGGGYSDESGVFGAITYQDVNVGGTGQRLSTNVQLGSRDFQFGVDFTNPYRASTPNRLGYSVNAFRRRTLSSRLTEEVRLPNNDVAREVRLGGGVSVMRPVGEWDAELGLNYSNISIRDSSGDSYAVDEQGNPLTVSGNGSDDLFTVSLQMTQDDRNSPVNPSSGSVLTLQTDQSIPIGQGNILMNRIQANYAYYVPVNILDAGTVETPEVLAFNLQGGTIFGDAPPYNAFALGGANSVRGYREGRLGTGRSYVLASAEYRFPIFRPVAGVFFADFASDLGTADEVLGEPAIARNKPGTGFGYGFGIRVVSPLGLIRADYGFNDDGESRLHVGIGQRF